MAAGNVYLSNPVVTVNAVALTTECTAAQLTRKVDQLEVTSFGDTDRTFSGGLGNHTLTLTLYMSYAAGKAYATLKDLVGTTTTVTVKPSTGANSATNPSFQLVGTFLAELPVMNASLGNLGTVDVTFQGGVYSALVV